MERFVHDSIPTHLVRTYFLNDAQHNFVSNSSPLTNMHWAQHDISTLLDTRQCVEIIFLSLSQVFYIMNHRLSWPTWKHSWYPLNCANRWQPYCVFEWVTKSPSSCQWSSPSFSFAPKIKSTLFWKVSGGYSSGFRFRTFDLALPNLNI